MGCFVIIDDSDFQRRTICRMVKNEGHQLHEARNGLEGLFKIATHWPDAILSDLVMPEVDGFSVLERLRAKNIDIPLIVISADVQDTTRKKCQELGAVDFLNKPVEESKVVTALRNVLTPRQEN